MSYYDTAADRLSNLIDELVADLRDDGFSQADIAVAGMCYREIEAARAPKNGRGKR